MLSALLLCVDIRGVRREGDWGGGRAASRAVKRLVRSSSAMVTDSWVLETGAVRVCASVEIVTTSKCGVSMGF